MKFSKVNNYLWKIVITYIFLRPLLCSAIFPEFNYVGNIIFSLTSLPLIISNKKLIKCSYIDSAILAFLITIIFSILFSRNYFLSLRQLLEYTSLIILVYLIRIANIKMLKTIIFTLLLGSIVLTLYSLRTYFIISKLSMAYLENMGLASSLAHEFIQRKRALSPFILPNLLASYLSMSIILFLGVFFGLLEKNKKTSFFILSTISLVLCIWVLFLTKSVSAWLSLVLALYLFFLTTGFSKKIFFISTTVGILLLVTTITIRWHVLYAFIHPLYSVLARINYWKETLQLIKTNPFFGVGMGNFVISTTQSAHNSYLQIWAEGGIFVLMSYLAIVYVFIKTSYKEIRRANNKIIASTIISVGMVFLLQNIVDFSFFIPQASFLFWLTIGLSERVKESSDCLL